MRPQSSMLVTAGGFGPAVPITLSLTDHGTGLTVTSFGASNYAGGASNVARASRSFLSGGKAYFEVQALGNPYVGLGRASTSLLMNTASNSGNAGAVVLRSNGYVGLNGVTGVSITGAWYGTMFCFVAVDLTSGLIWYQPEADGIWNGSGLADPATGVGGINITSIGGPLFIIVAVDTLNDGVQCNFGASAWRINALGRSVPAGFLAANLVP